MLRLHVCAVIVDPYVAKVQASQSFGRLVDFKSAPLLLALARL